MGDFQGPSDWLCRSENSSGAVSHNPRHVAACGSHGGLVIRHPY